MEKIKVLFVCIHNSARSQMAEAFLKKHGGAKFEVESAGLEPGKLNPWWWKRCVTCISTFHEIKRNACSIS